MSFKGSVSLLICLPQADVNSVYNTGCDRHINSESLPLKDHCVRHMNSETLTLTDIID